MLNLHQKTDPKVQQDFKGQGQYRKIKGQIKVTPTHPNQCCHQFQLATPYSFRDIAGTRFYTSRSLQQG